MKKRQNSFVKNIVSFSLASYVGALLSLFSIPIITRIFSPYEMGRINMFLSYSNILLVFCNMGFEQAFVRFFNENEDGYKPGALAGLCLFISLIFSFIVFIITVFFYQEISLSISGEVSFLCIVCLVFVLLSRVVVGYTSLISRMHLDLVIYSLQSILAVIMIKCVYIIAAFWDASYKTAIIILTASNVLLSCCFLIFFVCKKMITRFGAVSPKMLVKLSKYSIPLVPTFFLSTASMYLSQFMLRRYVGFEAIGIYTNAVTIAAILSLVQSGFNAYWPAFVYANYKTEQLKIQKVHNYITFMLVIFALMIIIGQDVLYLFVGEGFRSSKTIFSILVIVPVTYTIAETTRIGVRIAQKTYYDLFVSILVLALNFIICVFLIPIYGIIGAALGSAISSVAGLTIISYLANRYYKSVNSFLPMSLSLLSLFLALYMNFIQNKYAKISGLFLLIAFICVLYRKELNNICMYIKGVGGADKKQ